MTKARGFGGIAQLVAASRQRLMLSLVVALVPWGLVTGLATSYVRESSSSPGVDLMVITGWMLLTFGVAVVAALLAADYLFGAIWRRINILGEPFDVEVDEMLVANATKNRSMPLAMMVVLAIVGLGAVMHVVTDDFFGWYARYGYATSTLRGDNEENKLEILSELTRALDARLITYTDMIEAQLDAPNASDALKTHAILCLGEIGRRMVRSLELMDDGHKGAKWVRRLHEHLVQDIQPRLMAAFEAGPTGDRSDALVFALGSLKSPEAIPLLTAYLRRPDRNRDSVQAVIAALSAYRTPSRTVPALLPILASDDKDLAGLAAWAIGEMYGLGTGEAEEARPNPALVKLIVQILPNMALAPRCTLLDAMLRIRAEEFAPALFTLWERTKPRARCPRVELERPFQSPIAICKEEEVREKIVQALAAIAEGNSVVMAWLRRTGADEAVAEGLRADMNYILDVLAQRTSK